VNEEKATRYQRLKRRTSVLSVAWGAAVLLMLLLSGASAGLRDAARSLAAGVGLGASSGLILTIYVVLLTLLNEAGSLPLSFYSGFLVERRYGLSAQRLRAWMGDQFKGLALGLLLAMVAANIVYACIRWMPGAWWAPAGLIFAVLIVGLAKVAPVVLLPVFYTVKPLDRETLRGRLLTLAERAGARVVGAYEWGLAEKTRKANAALTGLGSTRRILVSDTMLSEYSEDEIEVVLAHELAHHVHGDIWKGLFFESGLIVAGFYVAFRVLDALAPALALENSADPAGLPLLLLAGGVVSLAMVPAANALSRRYERSADRFALELTRNPAAFISAMRRLGAQNLAEEHPSRAVQWLFYSHPPIADRIAVARAFKA